MKRIRQTKPGKKRKKTRYTDSTGQFARGNPGRPPGTVSESVHLARRITADNSEKLLQKAIELALAGDVCLLKLFANKLLGKRLDSGLTIPLSKSPVKMTRELLRSLQRDGQTADDAAGLAQVIDLHLRATELDELSKRIEALETATAE